MLHSEEASAEAVATTGLIHRIFPARPEPGLPLILLVHGRTGDQSKMWTFSRALSGHRCLILSPQAIHRDPLGGFAWWPVPDEKLSEEEKRKIFRTGLLEARDYFRRFIAAAVEYYGAPEEPIIGIGFSQGAGLLSTLSLYEPELFRGVALLAGFVPRIIFEEPGFLSPTIAGSASILPRYFIAHGREDRILPIEKTYFAEEKLRTLGATVGMEVEDVGHKVGSQAMRGLDAWIDGFFLEAGAPSPAPAG